MSIIQGSISPSAKWKDVEEASNGLNVLVNAVSVHQSSSENKGKEAKSPILLSTMFSSNEELYDALFEMKQEGIHRFVQGRQIYYICQRMERPTVEKSTLKKEWHALSEEKKRCHREMFHRMNRDYKKMQETTPNISHDEPDDADEVEEEIKEEKESNIQFEDVIVNRSSQSLALAMPPKTLVASAPSETKLTPIASDADTHIDVIDVRHSQDDMVDETHVGGSDSESVLILSDVDDDADASDSRSESVLILSDVDDDADASGSRSESVVVLSDSDDDVLSPEHPCKYMYRRNYTIEKFRRNGSPIKGGDQCNMAASFSSTHKWDYCARHKKYSPNQLRENAAFREQMLTMRNPKKRRRTEMTKSDDDESDGSVSDLSSSELPTTAIRGGPISDPFHLFYTHKRNLPSKVRYDLWHAMSKAKRSIYVNHFKKLKLNDSRAVQPLTRASSRARRLSSKYDESEEVDDASMDVSTDEDEESEVDVEALPLKTSQGGWISGSEHLFRVYQEDRGRYSKGQMKDAWKKMTPEQKAPYQQHLKKIAAARNAEKFVTSSDEDDEEDASASESVVGSDSVVSNSDWKSTPTRKKQYLSALKDRLIKSNATKASVLRDPNVVDALGKLEAALKVRTELGYSIDAGPFIVGIKDAMKRSL